MSVLPTQTLSLSKLESGLPGITQAWGTLLAEGGVVSLVRHRHPKGVDLSVDGISSTSFSIHWEREIDDQLLNAWEDEDEYTEYGACGIAILLTLELTPYTIIRRARKGTGVDYWLGYKGAVQPFQDAARLEISGIFSGNKQTIRTRVNQKIKQTEPTDGKIPAYIVVVEFSSPVSHVAKK